MKQRKPRIFIHCEKSENTFESTKTIFSPSLFLLQENCIREIDIFVDSPYFAVKVFLTSSSIKMNLLYILSSCTKHKIKTCNCITKQ